MGSEKETNILLPLKPVPCALMTHNMAFFLHLNNGNTTYNIIWCFNKVCLGAPIPFHITDVVENDCLTVTVLREGRKCWVKGKVADWRKWWWKVN